MSNESTITTEKRRGEPPRTDTPQRARRPYRPPALETGERLEQTSLSSCTTGPAVCGPGAVTG